MGPNGKQAYDKRLSGMGLTLGKCYKKAGEVCPEGYLIVGQNSSTAVTSYNGSFTALPKHKLTMSAAQVSLKSASLEDVGQMLQETKTCLFCDIPQERVQTNTVISARIVY